MQQIREVKRRTNICSLHITQFELDYPVVTLVAIDPGVTTGIASIRFENGSDHSIHRIKLVVSQHRDEGFWGMMRRITDTFPKSMTTSANKAEPLLIFEKYVARPTQHGHLGAEADRQLSPVAVMGKIEGFYDALKVGDRKNYRQKPRFLPQQASEMASFSDARLKAMFPDIYALTLGPAMPHARDALRHLLVYLKRHHFPLYQVLKTPEVAPRRPTRKSTD